MGLIQPTKIVISKASESRLKSLKSEESKIQSAIIQAQEDLKSNERAARRAGKKLSEIKKEIDEGVQKLDLLDEDISKKRSEKNKYDLVSKKVEEQKKELNDLSDRKSKNQKLEDILSKKIKEKDEELRYITDSLNKEKLRFDSKLGQIKLIDEKLNVRNSELEILNKDLTFLRKDRDQIREDKTFVEKARKEMPNYEIILKDVDSLRVLKKSLGSEIKEYERKLSSKQKEIGIIEKGIKEKRTKEFELIEKLGTTKRDIEKEKAKIKSERNRLITLKTEIQDMILEYRDKIKSQKLKKLVRELDGK